MVQSLCETYGWTLEYAMGLTMPQVSTLARGSSEMSRLRKQIYERETRGVGKVGASYERPPAAGTKSTIIKATKDNVFALLGMSKDFKATERLKRFLAKKAKKDA